MLRNILFLVSLLYGIAVSDYIDTLNDDSFDIRKNIFKITDYNIDDLKEYQRNHIVIALFTSHEQQYGCYNCKENEEAFVAIHKSYYELPESLDNEVLFAIALVEDSQEYFRKYHMTWIPYIHIRFPKTITSKVKVIGSSSTTILDKDELLKFINENLKVDIRLPISEKSIHITLFAVIIISIIFSLLYLPGRGLFTILNLRSSYASLCLIIIFLCLSCVAYILINSPMPFSVREGRKGRLIYSFFSQEDNMLMYEGAIVAFWLFLIFISCIGLIYWVPQCTNTLMSTVVISICCSVFLVSALQVQSFLEYSKQFLGSIVDYTKEAVLGNHYCIFCESYWRHLMRVSERKRNEWQTYFKQLKVLWGKCFK